MRQREGSGWDRWHASAVVAPGTEPHPVPIPEAQPSAPSAPASAGARHLLSLWFGIFMATSVARSELRANCWQPTHVRLCKGLDPKFAKWMGQGREGCWLWTCYGCEEIIWTFGSKRKWSSDCPASDLPLPGAVLTKMVATPGSQANQVRGGCLSGSRCSVNCVQSEPQQTSYYLYLSV